MLNREISVQDIEMEEDRHGLRLRESAAENDKVGKYNLYKHLIFRHDAIHAKNTETGTVL